MINIKHIDIEKEIRMTAMNSSAMKLKEIGKDRLMRKKMITMRREEIDKK
jgi:hypothetical protein